MKLLTLLNIFLIGCVNAKKLPVSFLDELSLNNINTSDVAIFSKAYNKQILLPTEELFLLSSKKLLSLSMCPNELKETLSFIEQKKNTETLAKIEATKQIEQKTTQKQEEEKKEADQQPPAPQKSQLLPLKQSSPTQKKPLPTSTSKIKVHRPTVQKHDRSSKTSSLQRRQVSMRQK